MQSAHMHTQHFCGTIVFYLAILIFIPITVDALSFGQTVLDLVSVLTACFINPSHCKYLPTKTPVF
jgi:hypothetical protein